MISIKENYNGFKIDSVNAIISGNTIIPGINGRKVNVNKSYKRMKANGFYNEDLYVFDYIKPNISLSDNKDKIITNINSKKRMVSLIFLVDNDPTDILKIINNYNVKANFFIKNKTNINFKPHNMGIISDDYSEIELFKMTKDKYCLSTDNNKPCIDNDLYLVKPFKISSNTPLLDIENNLDNNKIFLFTINKSLKRELPSIIIYLKSKGYTITNLDEAVLE